MGVGMSVLLSQEYQACVCVKVLYIWMGENNITEEEEKGRW